ncbi:hypothetical protein SH597_03945 [Lacticaseibacillus paracasei]|nr:hypothetical protein [Lacticaseibacillus paracasei]QPB56346.1 hypothetical protein GFB64_04230 [Lacticaseibacillus paracasei]WPQ31411.1 hypothetical protein SH597_03945 [Lacticaseibacillus paracasei]
MNYAPSTCMLRLPVHFSRWGRRFFTPCDIIPREEVSRMQNKKLKQQLANFVSTGFKNTLANQTKIRKEQTQMQKDFKKQKENISKYFKN